MNLKFYLNRRGIALFAMLILTLIQVSVFLSFSTDNNGDPNAYVHVAKTIFKEKFEFRSFRFVGYPLFLKISTLNVSNINLLFLIQSCLFLSAVYFFGRAVTKTFLGFFLVVIPGIVPSIAYLSKLAFPDCLILSLILFILGSLIKKNYKWAILLSVILFLVKIVFVFLLIIVVSIYCYKNYRNHREVILALTAGLMIAIYPIAFIYQPLPLYMGLIEEAGYMVNDPLVKKVNLDKILVKCGGREVVILDPSIISRIRLHNMDVTAPLTPEYSNQIGCSKKENGDIQRNLIRQLFFDDFYHAANKVTDKFLGAIFIRPELDHVHQMLIDKSELVKKYLNPLMYYEGGQVKFFREWWGLEPAIPPGVQIIEIAPVIDTIIKNIFSYLVLCVIFPIFIINLIFFRFMTLGSKESIAIFVLFLASYSIYLSTFAFIVDRYIYINYFVWMAIFVTACEGWVEKFRESIGQFLFRKR